MDDLAEFNRQRWNDLAREGVAFGRPWLALTPEEARRLVDPQRLLGEVAGKRVLLLAGGGGQQSAAFGLLGAQVTVLDLSEVQLAADRLAAEHYGLRPRLEQGDMRDLSRFADASFDLVWHAHSLGFVPDARVVFRQVARVLCRGGVYRLSCNNPFLAAADENSWNGTGYQLTAAYRDGAERPPVPWDIWGVADEPKHVPGPREFVHALSTLVNVPIGLGFQLLGAGEAGMGSAEDPPGSWGHFTTFCPPYLVFCWRLGQR
jgi:SAM-dependent methyltransferase